MPNGFYPVKGLDVILLNRTEQDHPTLRWRQFRDELQAVCLTSYKGYGHYGPLNWRDFGQDGLQGMQRAIQNAIVELHERDETLDVKLSYGDGISINFNSRRGIAFGSWFIYRINAQGTTLLHGGGAPGHVAQEHAQRIAQIPQEQREIFQQPMSIIEQPIRHDDPIKEDTSDAHFEFDAHDDIVISTTPLHFDKHWPFATLIDAACIMLTQRRAHDELLILWQNPDKAS